MIPASVAMMRGLSSSPMAVCGPVVGPEAVELWTAVGSERVS